MNEAAALVETLRERLQSLVGDVAPTGVSPWDVLLNRGPRGWHVRVILDRLDGPVTVADCAEVNTRLRARLELESLLAGDFDLEVSSPGLDRALRGPGDFFRFRGRLARLKISEGLKPEVVVGRVVAVTDAGVALDMDAGRRDVAWESIMEAKLEPELPGFEKKTPPAKAKRGKTTRRGRGRR